MLNTYIALLFQREGAYINTYTADKQEIKTATSMLNSNIRNRLSKQRKIRQKSQLCN